MVWYDGVGVRWYKIYGQAKVGESTGRIMRARKLRRTPALV